jgi:hypothetical protein
MKIMDKNHIIISTDAKKTFDLNTPSSNSYTQVTPKALAHPHLLQHYSQ